MQSKCKSVLPSLNTMAIFTTDDRSFHGHPHSLSCPEGVCRESIALYYYSSVMPTKNFSEPRVSTNYRPIEGDSFGPGLSKKKKGLFKRLFKKSLRV